MSRSKPNEHAPNPAVRWFEWNGEHGVVRYYDKPTKSNVVMDLPFSFLWLDELASVRGWHDASESGIYSNEVRDTRKDILVVKSFKGGTLAEGLYRDIKDRVNSLGGQFVSNVYVGFKDNGGLSIGSLRFKGAALGKWSEFRKAYRRELLERAVEVVNFEEGKKGRIVYRVPVFGLKAVSAETQMIAVDLDKELQAWMDSYFARRTSDQVPSEPTDDESHTQPLTDDDIPFSWLLPYAVPVTALIGGALWV